MTLIIREIDVVSTSILLNMCELREFRTGLIANPRFVEALKQKANKNPKK